jgi:hypothetical protein
MDSPVCPHCGDDEPGTPDHEVAQILEDLDITMDDLRGIVQEGGTMPSPKINRQEGASHPFNRAGEGAPRFGRDGGSVEYEGRSPAEEPTEQTEQTETEQPVEVGEQADPGTRLERPKDSDTKDKWLAYGNQQDPTVDNTALTKADLIELYG